MEANRPGDLLAERYRLGDLLSEARNGRFWMAQDDVLGRPVAIHVIPEEDSRAAALLAAARDSATVPDAHLLHVLDADTTDGIVYVVNEWGVGTSVDHLIAEHGPLPPRRAAWITAEVASCLAAAHERGHAHGRLRPENVLLGEDGGIHVIGFAVEAALYGVRRPPEEAMEIDRADLGGLLYALLSGKWAGVSASDVPAAPTRNALPLRPRQVRAGVPRVLDDLVMALLVGPSDQRPTAATTAVTLREYVGDASDLLGSPVTGSVSGPRLGAPPVRRPAEPVDATVVRSAPFVAGPEVEPVPEVESTPEVEPVETTTAASTAATPAPDDGPATEAALPVWDMTPEPRTPPPPPEPVVPKPLFADEPHRPRYQEQPVEEASPELESSWIFSPVPPTVDVVQPEEPVPGRNWLRLALGLALGIGIVVAALLIYLALDRHGEPPPAVASGSPSAHPSASAPAPQRLTGLTASTWDPEGGAGHTEYPELARYAVDGSLATSWHTYTYLQQFGPHGLKTGLGLVVDLGRTVSVRSLDVTVTGTTGFSVYVSPTAPSGSTPPTSTPAARTSGSGSVPVKLGSGVTGRYVTIWLTSLPHVKGGWRGQVDDVSATGIPAT